MKKLKNINLLELKPRKLFPSEFAEKGKIVVLVPKFRSKYTEWLMPKLSKTNFRVKLDFLGSFVWENCDGIKTVQEIADRMKSEYGTKAEPVYERVGEFIKRLHRGKLVDLNLKKEQK